MGLYAAWRFSTSGTFVCKLVVRIAGNGNVEVIFSRRNNFPPPEESTKQLQIPVLCAQQYVRHSHDLCAFVIKYYYVRSYISRK